MTMINKTLWDPSFAWVTSLRPKNPRQHRIQSLAGSNTSTSLRWQFIHGPTIINGQELWVVTERMEMQDGEKSFLQMLSGVRLTSGFHQVHHANHCESPPLQSMRVIQPGEPRSIPEATLISADPLRIHNMSILVCSRCWTVLICTWKIMIAGSQTQENLVNFPENTPSGLSVIIMITHGDLRVSDEISR